MRPRLAVVALVVAAWIATGSARQGVVNFPLRTLITTAYGIEGFQLVGAPGWVAEARFDGLTAH